MKKTIRMMVVASLIMIAASMAVSAECYENGFEVPCKKETPATDNAGKDSGSKPPTRQNSPLGYFEDDDGNLIVAYNSGGKTQYKNPDGTPLNGNDVDLDSVDPENFAGLNNYLTFDGGETVYQLNNGKLDQMELVNGKVLYGNYWVDNDENVYTVGGNTPIGELDHYYVNGRDTLLLNDGEGNLIDPKTGEAPKGDVSSWDVWASSFGRHYDSSGTYQGNGLADTFMFLSSLSRSLDGYPYISMFFEDEDEDMVIGNADDAFYTKVLGGKDTFISYWCRAPIAELEDETPTIVGGEEGGETASGWMAAEKIPYTDFKTGKDGFIYKVGAELTYGSCEKMSVQMLIDSDPLVVDNTTGQAYTFNMGTETESDTLSYTGQGMLVLFSEEDYSQVCFYFTELSQGCLLDITAPKTVCWNIDLQTDSASASMLAALDLTATGCDALECTWTDSVINPIFT